MTHQALVYQVVFILSVLWPAYVICRRAGVHPAWAATVCVPLFGVVVFSCALAFQKWTPASRDAAS
jgi:hypothetical protein